MTPLIVILTVAVYFALLLTISRIASRRADNATFFTGNRRTPWPIVAFAMAGAVISGVTFISVPGMVAAKGYSYLQMVLGFLLGYTVIAFVLIPLFYRKNLVSIYSYLEDRFGRRSYRSGAAMFFVSEILGASVRFFVVCAVLQLLVCEPLGVPFIVNVMLTISLIWLYTARGGVKTLIWTDVLKSFCLISSVVLCIYYIARNLGMSPADIPDAITSHASSRIFHFDDPKSPLYFWKQFIAGVFMAIVMNGLNQDMMQRHLSCRDSRSSAKNMIVSGVVQIGVIALFLMLGTLLLIYSQTRSIAMPEKSDDLFGLIAAHDTMPLVVGLLFIVGLISAAYSAAGSALTSLTTSFTLDILDGRRRYGDDDAALARLRSRVHLMMSAAMAVVIITFYYLSSDDAISAIYTLASYTYGPILGMFAYGLLTDGRVADRLVPAVCIVAPVLSWITQWALDHVFGYSIGFELLLLNGFYTMAGLKLTSILSPTITTIITKCRKIFSAATSGS
ncbi:MAG: sodium:solute symporter [Bacteroides sp.]|nr:sodium:solute symporter [Bacteroides sp.]MCM1413518.1 sodium:solute symporter [Bacteroides sp.]MCM1471072.1 sodium:solute symporter [Bacteroides sp.]